MCKFSHVSTTKKNHRELARGGYFLRASKKSGGKEEGEDKAKVEDEGAAVPVDGAGVVRGCLVLSCLL